MTGFAYTALGKAVARYIKEAGLPVKINTDSEMLMALHYIKAELINTEKSDEEKIASITEIFERHGIRYDDIE